MTIELLDSCLNSFNSVFQSFKSINFLRRGSCYYLKIEYCQLLWSQHYSVIIFLTIQWRCNKINFDGYLFSRCLEASEKCLFNSINSFIAVASAFNVSTYFHRLRCQLPLDVGQQHILRVLIKITFVQERWLQHGLLKNIIRGRLVFVLLLEVPGSFLIQLL